MRSANRELTVKTGPRDNKIAAVYVTRFQKERWANKDQQFPKIDAAFLKEAKYSKASVLHPLPRVDELDVALDSDVRAVYFEQAAYGVPVRMALISLLLQIEGGLARYEGGFFRERMPAYDQALNVGLRCANQNCIVHDETEAPYVRNKFHLIRTSSHPKLRCLYCETDIESFAIASKKNKWYSTDPYDLSKIPNNNLKDFIFFASDTEAQENGFHFKGRHGERKLS